MGAPPVGAPPVGAPPPGGLPAAIARTPRTEALFTGAVPVPWLALAEIWSGLPPTVA